MIRKYLLLISFILVQSTTIFSQSYKWDNVAMGGGGFVSAIITSKSEQNLMYARTDVGGAYRWDAATNSWISLLDWASQDETGYLGVEALAIDPQASGKLYMLVGISYFNNGKTAILRSSDYGKTFTVTDVSSQFKAHGNGMGRQNGEKLVVDPNNSDILYCGSRWNGLFKSINGGASWSRVTSLNVTTTPNENGISFVLVDPKSGTKGNASQTIYVGVSTNTGTNFYVSKNGGTGFTAVSGAPTAFMPQRAALASDGNMFITYGNGAGPHGHWNVPEPMDQGQVWKYNTSTGAWTNVTPSGMTRAFGGICVDPNNPNRLVASTINTYMLQYGSAYGDRIFLSTNGGSNWTDVVARGFTLDANGTTWITGHAIHWAGSIEFDPFNSKKVFVTSGNGVFSNDNIDATATPWKFNIKGLEETVPLDIVSITGGPLFSTIGDYDGFKHTDVSQYAPIYTPGTGTTSGIACAALNNKILLRAGNSMYYTTDQGITWKSATINGAKGKVAISANGSTFLHCPEKVSTTYRSTTNGSSWTPCNGLSVTDALPVADPVNSNKFYAYNSTSGVMLVSTDAGVNFSNSGTAGTGGSKIIRTVPGKEGHVWVPLYWGGLTRSSNSGQSFNKINNVTYCAAVGFGKAAPGSSYHAVYIWGTVNGVVGVYRSDDEGTTWVRINDNDHEYGGPGNGQFVVGDMNTYGRVYMSTAGRGIAYGELQSIPTGINSESASVNATVIYPNPSSNTFNVRAREEIANLAIVNIYGQKIYEVKNISAGREFEIDADIADGTYLVQVDYFSGRHEVMKLVRIK